jgi:hypothetical protein
LPCLGLPRLLLSYRGFVFAFIFGFGFGYGYGFAFAFIGWRWFINLVTAMF